MLSIPYRVYRRCQELDKCLEPASFRDYLLSSIEPYSFYIPILHNGTILAPLMSCNFLFINFSAWARPHSAYEPYWVNRKNETGAMHLDGSQYASKEGDRIQALRREPSAQMEAGMSTNTAIGDYQSSGFFSR